MSKTETITDEAGNTTEFIYIEDDEYTVRITQNDGVSNIIFLTLSEAKRLIEFLLGIK